MNFFKCKGKTYNYTTLPNEKKQTQTTKKSKPDGMTLGNHEWSLTKKSLKRLVTMENKTEKNHLIRIISDDN